MKLTTEQFKELVREQVKLHLNEGVSSAFDKELKTLIKNIKTGSGIDNTSFKEHSDGELLAMFLNPIFQSALLNIKDRKGFIKNFKI